MAEATTLADPLRFLDDPPIDRLLSLDEAFPPEDAPEDVPQTAPPPHPAVLVLTTAEATRLLEQVRTHYAEATQGREANQERRALRYRRYLGDVSLRDQMQPWEDAPQLFLPLTRQTIETLVGRFRKALLGTPDTIQLQGVGDEDAQRAWRRQAFYRWQLFTLNHFALTLKELLMDAALDSLAVLKVYRYAQPTPLTPGNELLQTIVKYEALDIGTLLIPPDARGLQYPEARYLGQQLYLVPEDDFPGMRQRGFTLPDVAPGLAQVDSYTPDERRTIELERDSIHPDSWYEGTVELVEMYEEFTRDDGSRESLVVHWFPRLCGDGAGSAAPHLARVVRLADALPQTAFPRAMRPFFKLVLWSQPRQLRGMNVPDRLETYQDALNRLAEQMLHLGDITILPIVFANLALTGDLPDLTKIRPGAVVPLDNLGPSGLQIHQPQSANRHFVEQMQVFRSAAEEDSAVTAYTQGRNATQPNAPRTLGGLALLLQQGNEAHGEQVKDLAEQLSEPLRFGYGLWQNHPVDGLTFAAPQDAALEARLLGDEGPGLSGPRQETGLTPVTMAPADLSGLFDIRINVNPEAHLEQQKYLTMGERLDALLAPIWPEGRRLLWKHICERLGIQGFDRFYPEVVAKYQTMLQALGLQTQLAQFEMLLLQLQGPQAQASMAEAQAMTQVSQQAAAPPRESPAGAAPPAVGPPDFSAIIQALAAGAGTGGGTALAQAQVPETPNNAFTAAGA